MKRIVSLSMVILLSTMLIGIANHNFIYQLGETESQSYVKKVELRTEKDQFSSATRANHWYARTVDSPGDVGNYSSLVLDGNDRPHISYINTSTNNLKYAHWDGVRWINQTIEQALSEYTSIAVDRNDDPHISYRAWGGGGLKHACWNANQWNTQTVDSNSCSGLYSSITLDNNDKIHISYYDYTNKDLKYAYWNGNHWDKQTVDSTGDVGKYTSIALDSTGLPHISYYHQTSRQLKYAQNMSGYWDTYTVDNEEGLENGEYSSLFLNESDTAYISYLSFNPNTGNRDLRCAHGSIAAGWLNDHVDTQGNAGQHTSIAKDSLDHPHISYYDIDNGALKYAYYDGNQWCLETVDSLGNVGAYTSIDIDSNDKPHISYYDHTNRDLKYAVIDNELPTISDLSIQEGTTGDDYTVEARVQDNFEVGRVTLNWSHGPVGDGIDMLRQPNNIWKADVRLADDLESLFYTINAWDEADNTNSTNERTVPVNDNDHPVVADETSREGTTGDEFEFDMEVYDNIGLNEVYVIWDQGGPVYREDLTAVGSMWNGTILLDPGKLNLEYQINIMDHSDRQFTSQMITVPVKDNDAPEYERENMPVPPETGADHIFRFLLDDNVNVTSAYLKYVFMSGMNDELNRSEIELNQDSDDPSTWTGELYIPTDATNIIYFILAYDEEENKLDTEIHPDHGPETLSIADTIDPLSDAGTDQNVSEDTECELNGSESSDNIGIVNWTWTIYLMNGNIIRLYEEVSHFRFRDTGIYEAGLEVWDVAGNTAEDSITIRVKDATRPRADAGEDVETDQGEGLKLDGRGSSDNVGVANWTWTFTYDGEPVELYDSEPVFVFNIPGVYNITLTVRDEAGKRAVDHVLVAVRDTEKPVIEARVNGEIVNHGDEVKVGWRTTVIFDAKGSRDNVEITEFGWSGSGENGFEVNLDGVEQSYTFELEGRYQITLTVRDDAGNEEIIGFIIIVEKAGGSGDGTVTAKVVIGSRGISDGEVYKIKTGTALKLDGRGSGSKSSDIVSYDWTIELPDDSEHNDDADLVEFTFELEGAYGIRLVVTDDNGGTGMVSFDVDASKRGPRGKIIGPIKDDNDDIVAGATVSFIIDGQRYEAETDEQGMVAFYDFPDDTIPKGTMIKLTKGDEIIDWIHGEDIPALGAHEDEEGVPFGIIGAIVIVGIVIVIILIILIVKKNRKKKESMGRVSVLKAELRTMDAEGEGEGEGEEKDETGRVPAPAEESRPKEKKRGKKPEKTEKTAVSPDRKRSDEAGHGEGGTEEEEVEEWRAGSDDDDEDEDEWDEGGEQEEWGANEDVSDETDEGYDDEELPLPPPPEDLKEHLGALQLEKVAGHIKNIIPGYIITDKLGAGGFATVYKAINKDGVAVAIKMPKFLDETIDSSVLNKFQAEADIWKKLKHKNIVSFLDSNIRPVPYMTIELMEGGNLGGLLKDHRLSMQEAKPLMLGILDGLSYAHRMASVHRDIKPENILFTKDGVPKIADWGIGKFMASESVSQSIGTKGTFLYSAPEQFDKVTYGEVDWSTDIFQIGVVFYEMLTGINPFKADELAAVMGRILTVKPAPPSSENPDIPPEIDEIVMKCLEKRKEDRWRSTDVLYSKLRDVEKQKQASLKKYRRSLERALLDGRISDDEEAMLSELREHMRISEEEHRRLVGELEQDRSAIDV